MPLFFAAHGRTELCGTGIIVPPEQGLNPQGQAQAIAIGRRLREMLHGDPLDLIITSATEHARATGELAGGIVVYGGNVEQDPRLNPRGVPDNSYGKPEISLPWNDPAALDQLGVEPAKDVDRRTAELLRQFAGYAGSALIIGHRGTLPSLVQIASLTPELAYLPAGGVLNMGSLQLV
ncbi:MAG TPA: histidine phosphatase family protein [Bacillota bacterium]|nr:histidine phosphatase family protein [Bacillota bacterium]